MILPFLNGIFSFRLAPVTWALFLLNFAVFAWTYQQTEASQQHLESRLDDEVYSKTQGYIFARFVERHRERYPASIQKMAAQTIQDRNPDRRRILSSLAFRDTYFLSEILDEPMTGDEVALNHWRKKFEEVLEVQEAHPVYNLGLTQTENAYSRWLTYQFAHSGFSHFIGNMIFLLIFATALEQIIGGLGVLSVYLLSGIFGAGMYYLWTEPSAIPLIGASGAVSGIMALFAVLFWRHSVRFLFFLFIPKRGYAGFIFLPAWMILILWGLQDVAGYFATPSEFGGVAYSAHMGGELCGVLFGLLILGFRKLKGLSPLPDTGPIDVKPAFTRFV